MMVPATGQNTALCRYCHGVGKQKIRRQIDPVRFTQEDERIYFSNCPEVEKIVICPYCRGTGRSGYQIKG